MTEGNTEVRGRALAIPVTLLDPSRDVLAVRLEAESIESVAEACGEVRRAGLRIAGLIMNEAERGVVVHMILDFTGASAEEVEEALGRIGRIDGIRGVEEFDGSIKGLAAAGGYSMVTTATGSRAVVMTERALRGLLLGAREALGESAGEAFLYYAGLFSGRGRASHYMELYGDPEVAIEVNRRVLMAQGYSGEIRISRGPGGTYRFEVEHLLECELLSGQRRGRTSHWFRGLMAGFLEAALGGEWEVEEVECVNDGSNRCAFEARRRLPGPLPRPVPRDRAS